MKNTQIFIFILVALYVYSCKSINKTASSENKQNIENLKIEVEIGEQVNFRITNLSNEKIKLYQPFELKIEKFEDNSWKQLKILPCPCDAPCNASEESIEIIPKGSFNLTWNKKESWCGKQRIEGIRNTEYVQAENGKYRIKLQILKPDNSIRYQYKKFELN